MLYKTRTGRMGVRTGSNKSNRPPGRKSLAASATAQRFVGEGAERERRDHRVEMGVREREVLGVANA
jgi:hypothetical protein